MMKVSGVRLDRPTGTLYRGRGDLPVFCSGSNAGACLSAPSGDGDVVVLLRSAQLTTVFLGLSYSRHLPRLDVFPLQLSDPRQEGEHQLSGRAGEVETFTHGYDGDTLGLQRLNGFQDVDCVAPPAVAGCHYNSVPLP